ncbi:ATP-binding cassette domain-containing protein [Thermostichus vulcanus]|uniref:ATP-binding cassette domain-containing protein n=1 Tax=Thermostichus vulcanus str. 'Rupite' TaxID=2813851 RepID=A0ABT0CDU2_THEVL|nr:ATP-binding cassette domain-containing protein [Thermostichus vulcanus str. 'Rupite']
MTMSDTPAVSVQQLQKRYGSTVAVADVSFQVEPGQIYGVLGPNGAGKTTTLHCICTLLRPDAGQVEVCGIPVQQNPRAVREKLGFVAQEVALDKVLTGRELLQLQADIYHMPRSLAQERIAAVLQLLGLTDRADERTGTYSGGLRKRLDLAAGLLHQPQVLVLDEPTVGLDIQSRLAIWDCLRQLKEMGITVLLSSHYLEEIDLLADRVAIIDRGRVIAEGTPEELKARVGGERITVKLQEFAPAELAQRGAELLGSLPFVQQVLINSAQGNALNLVVKKEAGEDPLGSIRAYLQEHGLEVFSSSQSRPSLDDVYLAATGQTLLDAELAAAEAIVGKKKK